MNQSQYERTYKEECLEYNPLVSIITVVLNGIKYLEPCIESILQQNYPHIEHILIDGGSTDGTLDVLSNYCSKYPKGIRYISEPDKGTFDAANKGIKMAKGVILGFIGSDDMYEPGAIQTVVEFFMANPDAHLVYGGCNLINDKSELIGRNRVSASNLKPINGGPPIGAGPATFYKRELFEKIGLFDELASDFDLAIRAGKTFQIYRIEKVLANLRCHKGSITSGGTWQSRKRGLRDMYIVTRRHGGSIFSRYCMIYYAFVVIDWLRPVLGPIYPFVAKVTGKNIGEVKDDWGTRRKI